MPFRCFDCGQPDKSPDHIYLENVCKQVYLMLPSKEPPARQLLADALAVGGRVDFPTVTEICEHAFGDELQMTALAQQLASALEGDHIQDIPKQLKAVTVAHELLYDGLAREVMLETPGLMLSLHKLRKYTPKKSDGPARELTRLLASEIVKHLLS